jgi:hypothetical protein
VINGLGATVRSDSEAERRIEMETTMRYVSRKTVAALGTR